MNRYYDEKLSAGRLRRCYDLASDRVRQYLQAEIEHVRQRLPARGRILDLGCGYGRFIHPLLAPQYRFVGIDNSLANLILGRGHLRAETSEVGLFQMDAGRLAFADRAFDAVLCVQNGVSAFKVAGKKLIGEMIRVARPGAVLLLSSYAERFWPHRMEWFRQQSDHGLLGEIDWEATGNGVIVCTDGFRATTCRPEDFQALFQETGLPVKITEVDESSLFCEVRLPE